MLNEVFTGTAQRTSDLAAVTFQASLPASKIAGTYPIVTGNKDQVRLVFSGHFEGTQYTGSISEVGQGVSIPAGSWTETTVGAGADASSDH